VLIILFVILSVNQEKLNPRSETFRLETNVSLHVAVVFFFVITHTHIHTHTHTQHTPSHRVKELLVTGTRGRQADVDVPVSRQPIRVMVCREKIETCG
jgi:hypothetical protein